MYPVQDGVLRIFEDEKEQISKKEIFMDFKNNVLLSKLNLIHCYCI